MTSKDVERIEVAPARNELTKLRLRQPRARLTPLGRLLEDRRTRAGLSQTAAAERAGISQGRWRQIIIGFIERADGRSPTHPSPELLAHMASAVGMTPHELDNADEPQAAEELRRLILAR